MTMSAQAPVAPHRASGARLGSAVVFVATGACVLGASQAGPVALGVAIAYAVIGAAAPEVALLALAAGFGIAATVCVALLHWPGRVADILPIAVLCGIHGRAAIARDDRRAPVAVRWAALATLAVLAASVGVQLAISTVVLSRTGLIAGLTDLAHSFLNGSRAFSYLIAAVQFATCVGLYAAAAAIFTTPEKTGGLVRMAIAGGTAVAVLNITRVLEILLGTGALATNFAPILEHVRVSITNGDPNAIGSVFAMLATLAVAQRPRERGLTRWGCTAAAAVLSAALWLTGSRTALVVLVLAAVIATVWQWRTGWRTWIVLGALAGAMTVAAIAFPNSLVDRSSVVGAADIRAEMAQVAVRLWKTDPLLGVGVGQFLDRSGDFIEDPYVRTLYGRENAHNNFLQVLAELGIVGAAACALLLVGALWSSPPSGLRAAIVVFLTTCLAGHPLLLPDVAFLFAVVTGAAAAYSRALPALALTRAGAVTVLAAAIALPVSYRVERAHATFDHLGYGVSQWRRSPDGYQFRRSDGDATVFVPSAAPDIVLTIRSETGTPLVVRISLDGKAGDEIRVPAGDWFAYRMLMPPRSTKAFVALRLQATDAAGRPAAFDLAKITPRQ